MISFEEESKSPPVISSSNGNFATSSPTQVLPNLLRIDHDDNDDHDEDHNEDEDHDEDDDHDDHDDHDEDDDHEEDEDDEDVKDECLGSS